MMGTVTEGVKRGDDLGQEGDFDLILTILTSKDQAGSRAFLSDLLCIWDVQLESQWKYTAGVVDLEVFIIKLGLKP